MEDLEHVPVLKGEALFRKGELIYINKSTDLPEYMNRVHRHDFIEIVYVLSGTGVHVLDGREFAIGKGDLFLVNYDTPHGFFTKTDAGDPPVVYNCVFKPEFLDGSLLSSRHFQDIASSFLFNSVFLDASPSPDLQLTGLAFNEIGELFARMYGEYSGRQTGYVDMLRAYLIELVIRIFRLMQSDGRKMPSVRNKQLVDKAVTYLRQHYNTEIKLDDLATQCFISKNYFSRLFKEVTGTNFSDYVQRLRMDEACTLLRSSDMKVTDVALQCGFHDLKFFYEVFRKTTGMTPGDYRRQGNA